MKIPKPLFQLTSLASLLFLVGCPAPWSTEQATRDTMKITHDPARLAFIGPDACRQCHLEEVQEWERSHHFHANRPVNRNLDRMRFSPERILVDGNVKSRMYETREGFFIEVQEADGSVTNARFEGVLAYDPLQQYLAPFGRGMWQTTSVAYDPAEDEWFDVFPGEDRIPGEWGHWTGRAMNWNANCAYCHMTEFEKNYDPITDSYASRWLQHGIGCIQCHAGLEQHVKTATTTDAGILPTPLNVHQQLDSCRTCHSHREQLTADAFKAGDNYHDHFLLSLPDQPGLYYPDGQILDEVFVTGSFKMSTMGHAGVSCMDCHNPHSLELTMPMNNNLICMQCHADGRDGAQVIDPVAHSYHAADSTGNRCVECHMPHTVYMARDPRRDHGFLSPDPLLTREIGIPNACSRCHEEEGLDWVIDHAEEWYGERLAESEQRKRARLLHAIYEGADDPGTGARLLEMARLSDNDAWRATYTGLMTAFLHMAEAREWVQAAVEDPSPLVRQRAAMVLPYLPGNEAPMSALMQDDIRSVRLRAARMLSQELDPFGVLGKEWLEYIQFNADRVGGAMLLADHARRRGDIDLAKAYIRNAISLDRRSPEIYREAAIMMSRVGDDAEAGRILQTGLRYGPDNAGLLYSLALLRAAEGRDRESIDLLWQSVNADPQFYRAWYNLSIALARDNQIEEAARALRRSAPGMQNTQEWQQMRQFIEQRRRQLQAQ
jgi:tetratricopeptide (TPR) repeat protein